MGTGMGTGTGNRKPETVISRLEMSSKLGPDLF